MSLKCNALYNPIVGRPFKRGFNELKIINKWLRYVK